MTPRDMLIAVFVVSAGSLTIGVERSGATDAGLGSCAAYSGLPTGEGETAGMIFIPGGDFTMGSERHQPEERFAHSAQVDGFWIDRHEVTNAQFASSSRRPAMRPWPNGVSIPGRTPAYRRRCSPPDQWFSSSPRT